MKRETDIKSNGQAKFIWTPECEKAFEDIKEYVSRMLTLRQQTEDRPLILYITIGENAVSSAWFRKTTEDNNGLSISQQIITQSWAKLPIAREGSLCAGSLSSKAEAIFSWFLNNTQEQLSDPRYPKKSEPFGKVI